jgi:hypothetical protein
LVQGGQKGTRPPVDVVAPYHAAHAAHASRGFGRVEIDRVSDRLLESVEVMGVHEDGVAKLKGGAGEFAEHQRP